MKINSKNIILLTSLAGALALLGCNKSTDASQPNVPNNSPGLYVDDSVITAKVKAALIGDSAVAASEISVTTNSGVVTLSGQVDNADQKAAAVKDAASASGVKDITNNLTIKSPAPEASQPSVPNNSPGLYVDDSVITAKVKAALLGDSAVVSSEISVTTNSGVVTLSGQVDTSDQKAAAVKDAAGVSGVKDVTDTLTTK
jgi:hyperosmotically inducible protein